MLLPRYPNENYICTAIINPPGIQLLLTPEVICTTSFGRVILPHVMFWDPIVQFPFLKNLLEACPIDECEGILQFHAWANGVNKGMQPRLLHDIHYVVLLVEAVYKCHQCNHHVYSTDPRVLQKIEMPRMPFFLLHRRGFTRTFVDYIINLAHEGLAIQSIARHIQAMRETYVNNKIFCIAKDCKHLQNELSQQQIDFIANSVYVTAVSKPYPSNDLIARCIIIDFQQNEAIYSTQMASLPVTDCIRLDHTFKVASNIGYLRPDGRWITQYGSVFIVLNRLGQVITWQLTNTTSLDEVESLLCNLKQRIVLATNETLTVYVDNCCYVKSKIIKMLGESTEIKLDIFHAIQRITRVMYKKHLLFLPCKNDLKMLIRCSNDIAKKRKCVTPDSTQILANMEDFIKKWINAEHNGIRILTDKVMEQISLLKTHIMRGCLSHVEPGGGTNYNEALHRYINPHFNHAGRIGIPLAFAFLSILFYKYNSKKMPPFSLSASIIAKENLLTTTSFGIISKDEGGLKDKWLAGSNTVELSEDECDNEELYSLCNATEDVFSIPVMDIESIIKNAVNLTEIAKNIVAKEIWKVSHVFLPNDVIYV